MPVTLGELLVVPNCLLVLLRLHVRLGSPQDGLGVVVVEVDGFVTVVYALLQLAQPSGYGRSVEVKFSVGDPIARINLKSLAVKEIVSDLIFFFHGRTQTCKATEPH